MSKILDSLETQNHKLKYHLLFFGILSLNYIFPLLLFGEVTLFYHDALDIEIVYNKVIGEIYKNGFEFSNIFLGGEVKALYLRRLLQPYTFLYSILNAELAYWVSDILVKLTSYFSLYILAKKINKNILICGLASCLFASINYPTHEGFGIAILPYLIYLMLFKKKIKFAHYFIIFFFGLNTDLVRILLPLMFVPFILFIINKNIIKENLLNIILITFVFIFAITISNSNLIYIQLFENSFHREDFYREPLSWSVSAIAQIITLFQIPNELDWTFFYKLPFFIFLVPLIIFSFLSKNKKVYLFLSLLLFVHFYLFLLKLEFISELRYNAVGFIRTFGWGYIQVVVPLLHVLIFLYVAKKNIKYKNYLIYFSLLSLLIFQINSSFTPIVKKYFLNGDHNYKNIYTFNGYYSYKDYMEIKKIVKDSRILSIGLDPMVAIMNNIKTIDGYHTLYPKTYKEKFRKVIEDELKANKRFKKYYDNWGSRVYAFIDNRDNIKINYLAAKNLGAKYILSKYALDSELLTFSCGECKTNLYLYKIK